jgi:prenyl protein peptidase
MVYTYLQHALTSSEPEMPQISTATAVAVLVLYTLIYVLPFYMSSTTRPSATLSRDAPSVIRGRIRSVTVSCIICLICTFVFLSSVDNGSPMKSIHRMGFFPVGVPETGKALLLTAILFVGRIGFAYGALGKYLGAGLGTATLSQYVLHPPI